MEVVKAKTFEHTTGTLVLRDDQILHLKIKEGIALGFAAGISTHFLVNG